MVLTALLRSEHLFKVGVAVAPVTDWHLYDTAYTERYMQRPEDNPEGYESTSLLEVADQLAVPLLLVHGLSDDNVHISNSSQLIARFVKAGKMFETLFYPAKNHQISGPNTQVHLFSKITRFLEKHL